MWLVGLFMFTWFRSCFLVSWFARPGSASMLSSFFRVFWLLTGLWFRLEPATQIHLLGLLGLDGGPVFQDLSQGLAVRVLLAQYLVPVNVNALFLAVLLQQLDHEFPVTLFDVLSDLVLVLGDDLDHFLARLLLLFLRLSLRSQSRQQDPPTIASRFGVLVLLHDGLQVILSDSDQPDHDVTTAATGLLAARLDGEVRLLRGRGEPLSKGIPVLGGDEADDLLCVLLQELDPRLHGHGCRLALLVLLVGTVEAFVAASVMFRLMPSVDRFFPMSGYFGQESIPVTGFDVFRVDLLDVSLVGDCSQDQPGDQNLRYQ